MAKNQNIKLLIELEDLLKSHDWSYQYSDDHMYFKRGRASEEKIRAKMEECINANLSTVAHSMYNSHNPYHSETKEQN